MRRNAFFLILIILGAIAVISDLAFVVFLGITISNVVSGISFLPTVFTTLCIALIVINAVAIVYSILYILVLRK